MARKRWPPSAALTTKQAAHHVGLAASTLEKARIYGGGPVWTVLMKGAIRYLVADLDAWLAAGRTGFSTRRCADCPHRRDPA